MQSDAGVPHGEVNLDQAETAAIGPSLAEGRVELAFGADFVAGAAAEHFRQLVYCQGWMSLNL